ncbi:MAG: SDR family oxidoreductase [Planctomycetaceae bacterium]
MFYRATESSPDKGTGSAPGVLPIEYRIEPQRRQRPLGRWGEPADIANAVTFLCSSQASWMTGEVLRVSGGLEGVAAPLPKT